MKKSLWLLSLILLISITLFNSQIIKANSALSFGAFTPKGEISKELILSIPVREDSLLAVEIWLASNNFRSINNQMITGDRVELRTNSQQYILNNKRTRINKSELYQNNLGQLSLLISFTAKTFDLPGKYTNKIMIRKIYSEELIREKIIEQEVVVKINPWLLIRKVDNRAKIIIDHTSYRNKNLFSRTMPLIQIAANTSWKLYAVINESETKLIGSLKLLVPNQSTDYSSIKPKGHYLNLKPKLIAAGNKTVGEDGYWIDLSCSLLIDDFTKVRAGTIDFPINFYLEELD